MILNNLKVKAFLLIVCCFKATTQSDYVAGVVEFQPAQFSHPEWTSADKLKDNLNGYIDILNSNEAKHTDIIVFPEMSLNDNDESTFVPDPEKNLPAPCDMPSYDENEKYHDFLIELSCQAKNLSKYLVVNVVEKELCLPPEADPRPCASNGLNLFNTNVVFNRQGAVISRYRKVHLWGEPRNTTFVSTVGYFDTDFGVRFGHFVCFDLLFYTPAEQMVQKMGITDFVFPTMWFSQLPFLTGVQIQSAWSWANDVNFLAAGASYPAEGTTGSGIYAGRRGTLEAVMSRTQGQRKLIVATVKQQFRHKRQQQDLSFEKIIQKTIKARKSDDDIFLKQDYLENYETLQVNLQDGNSFATQLCHEKFCCNFKLEWEEMSTSTNSIGKPHYSYRIGAFKGLRKEAAPETNMLRNCALFACTGPNINDCGEILTNVAPLNVTFKYLSIEAKFPSVDEMLIMPNSLKANLLPLDNSEFTWMQSPQGASRRIRLDLTKPVSNLLTFSIYGNYYDSMDAVDEPIEPLQPKGDGATTIIVSLLLLAICVTISNRIV